MALLVREGGVCRMALLVREGGVCRMALLFVLVLLCL